MGYGAVFLVATLIALAVLACVPQRGRAAVEARLGALDAAGPGLVAVGTPRAEQVLGRRRARRSAQRWGAWWGHGWRLIVAAIAAETLALGGVALLGAHTTLALTVLTLAAWAIGLLVSRIYRLGAVRRQLPEGVRLLAQHMRDTNSLYGALEAVAQQGRRPLSTEFARLHAALTAGETEAQAFGAFASRNPVREAELLASALEAPAERGQRLAAALFRLHEVLEAGERSERAARTAGFALSGLGGGLVAVLVSLMGAIVRRGDGAPFTLAALAAGLVGAVAIVLLARSVRRA